MRVRIPLTIIAGWFHSYLSIFLIISGVVVLAWGIWPTRQVTGSVSIDPNMVSLDSSPVPMLSDVYQATLTWPARIRADDQGTIHLKLAPIAWEQKHIDSPGNLTGRYNLLVEARLDTNSLVVFPAETISQPMQPGDDINFFWQVIPQAVPVIRGTVWLHFHFIALDDSGVDRQWAVSDQPFVIQRISLLSLNGSYARILGGLGIVMGLILNMEGMMDWFMKLRKH